MTMKRKLIIYAHGNRNGGYCRLHFGYQINDKTFQINFDLNKIDLLFYYVKIENKNEIYKYILFVQ